MQNQLIHDLLKALPLWLGRVLAILVFLFWGAFFVEHLIEWFIQPFPNWPPPRVVFAQFLHLLMLVGLLIALRWERVGAVMVIVTAFAFFVRNAGPRFPLFFSLTVLPVALLWVGTWYRRHAAALRPG